MNKGPWYMIFAALMFSLMNVLVKELNRIPVFELVFFRSIFSLIYMIVLLSHKKIKPFGKNKKILILRGVFGTIALTLFFITLHKTPLAIAVIIQYLSPIFTIIFTSIFLKDKIAYQQWLFFFVSFIGVVFIKGFDESNQIPINYVMVGIISSVFSGLAYLCIVKLKSTDHHLVTVFYFPLISTPIMSILSFFNWKQPSMVEFFYLICVGFFSQIAQIYMTKGIQSQPSGSIMIFKYIGAIFALIFGYFIFDEKFSIQALFGIILLLLGVVLNIVFKKKPYDQSIN